MLKKTVGTGLRVLGKLLAIDERLQACEDIDEMLLLEFEKNEWAKEARDTLFQPISTNTSHEYLESEPS